MPKIPITNDELKQHLKEQLESLEDSACLFDQGKEHEAKRLATSIRVLLHDTSKSASVLQQLGVKNQLTYWSVLFRDHTQPSSAYMGIGVEMDGGGRSKYVANLFPPHRRLAFDTWWNDEPLIIQNAERLSRERAVLILANKDGGAHVEPKLDVPDHTLLRTDVLGFNPSYALRTKSQRFSPGHHA